MGQVTFTEGQVTSVLKASLKFTKQKAQAVYLWLIFTENKHSKINRSR